jgi:hypothetical protein
MSDPPPKPPRPAKTGDHDPRRERLAAALRDNLRKRKLQARARKDSPSKESAPR